MSIQSGVEKTMGDVYAEIKKATTIDPNKADILRNINKPIFYPVSKIKDDENIRHEIDTNSDDFKKLLESIKQDGILQSIIVEYRDKGSTFELVCVAGHRRLAAAKILGLERIQCLMQEYKEPSQRTRIALAENLIREGMHPLDIANSFKGLIDLGWNEGRIAEHYERDIKTIKRYLNIANWRGDIQDLVLEHKNIFNYSLVMKKYALKAIVSEEQQNELKNEFLSLINNSQKETKEKPSNSIAEELKQRLSLKIDITEKNNKGRLSISFNNEQEKAKILSIFGLKKD